MDGTRKRPRHELSCNGTSTIMQDRNSFEIPNGILSMMKLPVANNADDLDACFVGVPIDHGTSYKSGARFGPRNIRMESAFLRRYNIQTGADPLSSIRVADIGDMKVNLYDLKACCVDIREQMKTIIKNGCRPLVIGGDHTISYPTLQAMAEKYGPVAMVHVDAHSDCADLSNGEKIAHGTSFRRAIEEDLLQCNKVFQIGIRGPVRKTNEWDYQLKKGFKMIHAKDIWYKSLAPIMEEVRSVIGDTPTYMSFDIDALDPSTAPGTGFPEIGGLTSSQAMEIIQGCRGLDLVGADLVEVSPAFDINDSCYTNRYFVRSSFSIPPEVIICITSITAAHLLFEILCVLPGVKYL